MYLIIILYLINLVADYLGSTLTAVGQHNNAIIGYSDKTDERQIIFCIVHSI